MPMTDAMDDAHLWYPSKTQKHILFSRIFFLKVLRGYTYVKAKKQGFFQDFFFNGFWEKGFTNNIPIDRATLQEYKKIFLFEI